MRNFLVVVGAILLGFSNLAFADGHSGRNWTGVYIGGHVGQVWVDVGGLHDQTDTDGPFQFSSLDVDGIVGGVLVGYNHQVGSLVVGVEADSGWGNAEDTAIGPDLPLGDNVYTLEGSHFWSIRARLGVTPLPNLLVFGTVGWGGAEFDLTVLDNQVTGTPAAGSVSFNESGAVYGGGIAWALSDTVMVRTEYLHYDVGLRSALVNPPLPDSDPGDSISIDDVDIWRVGVSIKLGGLLNRSGSGALK